MASVAVREEVSVVVLKAVHPAIPEDLEEMHQLMVDLKVMGCNGFLERPWNVADEAMVTELMTGAPRQFERTARGDTKEWTAGMWSAMYGFPTRGKGWAS